MMIVLPVVENQLDKREKKLHHLNWNIITFYQCNKHSQLCTHGWFDQIRKKGKKAQVTHR